MTPFSPSASGASRVRAEVHCPNCCARVSVLVLYRYGEPGTFALGDAVRGLGAPAVLADGAAESPCPSCAWEGAWPVEVWLEQDRLAAVRPPSRRFNWVGKGSYITLDVLPAPRG